MKKKRSERLENAVLLSALCGIVSVGIVAFFGLFIALRDHQPVGVAVTGLVIAFLYGFTYYSLRGME